LEEVKEELADIFIYLMKLSMILDADLEEEFFKKRERNKIN
jgi:NTP pyrophosphatase (non-canonical NTP hydrolase)